MDGINKNNKPAPITADNKKPDADLPDRQQPNACNRVERVNPTLSVKNEQSQPLSSKNENAKLLPSRTVMQYKDINHYLKINGGPPFESCSNAAITSAYVENNVPVTDEELQFIAKGNFRSEANLRKQLKKHFTVTRIFFDEKKSTAENVAGIKDDDGLIIRYTHEEIRHAEFISADRSMVSNALEWGDENNRKSYISSPFERYCWFKGKGYYLGHDDEWVKFDRLYRGVGIEIFKLKLKPNEE